MLQFCKMILGFSKNKSIRILMYHKVLPQNEIVGKDTLTVSTDDLEQQLKYIKENYNTLFFKELEANRQLKNKLIITFDDGYLNNLQYLVPLLEKYQLKATIFVSTGLVEKDENSENRKMMTFEEIKSLAPNTIEIGLHGHSHISYRENTVDVDEKDLIACIKTLDEKGILYSKVLAYPYGQYPRERNHQKESLSMLERIGIDCALRIGNSIAYYPWKKRFLIKRIDIKGGDSFKIFKWKLRLGKLKF